MFTPIGNLKYFYTHLTPKIYLHPFDTKNIFTPIRHLKSFYTHLTPKIFLHPFDT